MKKDFIIVYLRAAAIIMIVFHHSLLMFQGWPPSDLSNIGLKFSLLLNLCDAAKAYGLGIFTFISGYLICFGNASFGLSYIIKKAKKILLPCMLAAIAYTLLFPQFLGDTNPIIGTHLWYLPMIFIFYLLKPILRSDNIYIFCGGILSFLFISEILSYVTCLTLFSRCNYYFGYYICGALFYRVKNYKFDVNFVVMVLAFVFVSDKRNFTPISISIIIPCLYILLSHYHVTCVRNLAVLKKCIVLISENSYSIYILHQFIINFLVILIPHYGGYLFLIFPMAFLLSLFIPVSLEKIKFITISLLRDGKKFGD